jgi:16S rRNA (cytosine1402-N4)-methyltransferase
MPTEHVPVLAGELIDLLDPAPGETAIDCTFGGGGHAGLVAERLGADGTLVCIDRDPVAAERFAAFAADAPCETRFVAGEFSSVLAELAGEGIRANLVYMDLGMSTLQLDAWERGFSYSYDAPLDMRMDPTQTLTAAEVVNEWPESRLTQVIREYGEERYARTIAASIARRRPLGTTSALVEAIKGGMPPAARFGDGHPARRTFQAIRIAVNDELGGIERGVPEAWELLEPEGRLGVISFHSLEDRLVKRFLAERARGCTCPPEFPVCVCGKAPEADVLTPRVVRPSPGEVATNPRARSARLRVGRKLATEGVS